MIRKFERIGRGLGVALLAALAILPAFVRADPPPNVYNSFAAGQAVHGRGQIRGTIESVNYGAGTLTIRTAAGTSVVAVLPSTEIYVKNQYATLADIHRGAGAELLINEVGGRLIAQVIRLQ